MTRPGKVPDANDPHDLERFVRSQRGVYEQAWAELRDGRKRSHWMWFVFPQFAGLGFSPTSQAFAIKSLAEARDYLAHPVLGPRLIACGEAALSAPPGRSASQIFGSPDDLKLRSSATLFAAVSPAGSVFHRLLDRFYRGEPDARTVSLIAESAET